MTVSYGNARALSASPGSNAPGQPRRRPKSSRTPNRPRSKPVATSDGFRSSFVRNSVFSTTTNADTYFDLNRRQSQLDNLRSEAGPNPDPMVIADFEDFQGRLDANRKLLDERAKIADRHVWDLLRSGLAPVDVGAGLLNIARTEADLRDYVAVATAIPVVGTFGKIGTVLRRGTGAATETISVPRRSLQHGFKHAEAFGIGGNANNQSLAEFAVAIERHIVDDSTMVIRGTFRGKPVTHFVNPDTGLNVMRNEAGDFLTGYRLDQSQLGRVLKNGKLGGGR